MIHLHAINANPASSTPVNFTFSGAGGEVCVVQDASGGAYVQADLFIRLNGLLNLTAANFALTTAQYNADIVACTTVASFLGSQTLLDQVARGFSIFDSLANVQTNLAALPADAGHINTVTLTSAAMSVTAADGASFTIDGMSLARFQHATSALQAAFRFPA